MLSRQKVGTIMSTKGNPLQIIINANVVLEKLTAELAIRSREEGTAMELAEQCRKKIKNEQQAINEAVEQIKKSQSNF